MDCGRGMVLDIAFPNEADAWVQVIRDRGGQLPVLVLLSADHPGDQVGMMEKMNQLFACSGELHGDEEVKFPRSEEPTRLILREEVLQPAVEIRDRAPKNVLCPTLPVAREVVRLESFNKGLAYLVGSPVQVFKRIQTNPAAKGINQELMLIATEAERLRLKPNLVQGILRVPVPFWCQASRRVAPELESFFVGLPSFQRVDKSFALRNIGEVLDHKYRLWFEFRSPSEHQLWRASSLWGRGAKKSRGIETTRTRLYQSRLITLVSERHKSR